MIVTSEFSRRTEGTREHVVVSSLSREANAPLEHFARLTKDTTTADLGAIHIVIAGNLSEGLHIVPLDRLTTDETDTALTVLHHEGTLLFEDNVKLVRLVILSPDVERLSGYLERD